MTNVTKKQINQAVIFSKLNNSIVIEQYVYYKAVIERKNKKVIVYINDYDYFLGNFKEINIIGKVIEVTKQQFIIKTKQQFFK